MASENVKVRRAFILVDDRRYTFDCVPEETYEDEAEITEHPVEGGSDTTDHVRNKPNAISLDVVVSNNPLSETDDDDFEIVGPKRAEAFFIVMTRIKALALPIQVFTTLLIDTLSLITVKRGNFAFVFSQFLIRRITVVRTKDTGNIVRMNLDLKAIVFVGNKVIDAPEGLVNPGADLGKQPSTEATEPEKDIVRSYLGEGFFNNTQPAEAAP